MAGLIKSSIYKINDKQLNGDDDQALQTLIEEISKPTLEELKKTVNFNKKDFIPRDIEVLI